MKLLVYYLADYAHGYGHKFRSNALVDRALELGHDAKIITNWVNGNRADKRIWFYVPSEYDAVQCRFGVRNAIDSFQPDWLIVDLEETVPVDIVEDAHDRGVKVAFLNGVGRVEENQGMDLIWVQDVPRRVILRPEIVRAGQNEDRTYTNSWFVWGGAADPLRLLEAFDAASGDPANLCHTELRSPPNARWNHTVVQIKDMEILDQMLGCSRACVHMGMISWELAALGLPTYVVCRSRGHMKFAKAMQKMGLLKAYPKVGLPHMEDLRQFLNEPFTPEGERPDGLGADRLLKELQERL